jgi:hypothetical protein
MIHTENIAPIKAHSGTENFIIDVRLQIKATATPKAAPPEIPNVNGSARGFFNIAWNTHPLIESPAPTMQDIITLGRRICFIMIIVFVLDLLLNNISKILKNEICVEPFDKENKNTTKTNNGMST